MTNFSLVMFAELLHSYSPLKTCPSIINWNIALTIDGYNQVPALFLLFNFFDNPLHLDVPHNTEEEEECCYFFFIVTLTAYENDPKISQSIKLCLSQKPFFLKVPLVLDWVSTGMLWLDIIKSKYKINLNGFWVIWETVIRTSSFAQSQKSRSCFS